MLDPPDAPEEDQMMRHVITLSDVQARAGEILRKDQADADPESAHCDQDELYEDVLRAVADGHPDAQEMARACIPIADNAGTRWYG
jgi:hypothetical protein